MTIGTRLKKLRNDLGITQKEAASKTGVNAKTLGGYENDVSTPDPETLQLLAKFYGVTSDYLISGEMGTLTDKKYTPKGSTKDYAKLDDFLETARLHFMDAKEEDMDKIMKCLQDVYWETKEINKKKFNPNKNKQQY